MIFNLILLFLIIGVTIIVHGLQGILSKILIHIMLFIYRPDTGLKPIALRSLKSHEDRNHRVGLIFSLTVACLLMGGSTF